MIRSFWQLRLGASDDEWVLYMLKGPIWYAWYRLQVKIMMVLWRIGAPNWVCGLPGAVMFWRWSDWWHASLDTRIGRKLRCIWRRKLGSRIYRLCVVRSKHC
ncbi:MAG: hypothetical protein KGZ31_02350 [Sulfuritalea sp.]|nr:hypothetical protein [Sulfuritalea sp.]